MTQSVLPPAAAPILLFHILWFPAQKLISAVTFVFRQRPAIRVVRRVAKRRLPPLNWPTSIEQKPNWPTTKIYWTEDICTSLLWTISHLNSFNIEWSKIYHVSSAYQTRLYTSLQACGDLFLLTACLGLAYTNIGKLHTITACLAWSACQQWQASKELIQLLKSWSASKELPGFQPSTL